MTFLMLLYFMFRMAMGGGGSIVPAQAYYTTDDGKTWFAADASNKAPFQHDGKQALRAHVFQCADKPPFVGYLSKYSSIAGEDMVKKAGETRWFPHSTPNAAGIMTIKCGEGADAKPATEIFPQ